MQSASSATGGLVQHLTIPNCISVSRLLAAPMLVVLANGGHELVFLAIALFLLLTDWVDGRIARAFNQQSTLGARLDAWSDAIIYLCIAAGVWLLRPEQFWSERSWLGAIAASYLLSLIVCLVKFGCLPNYHTRTAKVSWFLITVGVTAMLLNYSIWPLRFACLMVTVANLESIAITFALRRWRPDVSSLFTAVQRPDEPIADPAEKVEHKSEMR